MRNLPNATVTARALGARAGDGPLAGCRAAIVAAAGFSLLINLLLLTVPLYTMQVFDRVLASRSRETLLYLTVLALGALLLLGWLELVRARTQALRDIAHIRQFVGGPVAYDAIAEY
jgi:ABC-type protease/lipase transport system fused ATPase/permease subunit